MTTHKYQSVSHQIEENIKNGTYPTDKLPTEEELGREFDVSRNTIRKAIDQLVKKGLILSVQGSGIFIRNVFPQEDDLINLENFKGLSADYGSNRIETKLLEFKETQADASIAEIMRCDVGTPLYFINRLRVVDGKKWVIEYSYFNRDLIPFLNTEIIENSIYNFIVTGLKKQVGFVDRMIEARPITKFEADLLDLEEGDPGLVTTNKSMFKTGEIFDYSIDVHNFKHARFLKLSNL